MKLRVEGFKSNLAIKVGMANKPSRIESKIDSLTDSVQSLIGVLSQKLTGDVSFKPVGEVQRINYQQVKPNVPIGTGLNQPRVESPTMYVEAVDKYIMDNGITDEVCLTLNKNEVHVMKPFKSAWILKFGNKMIGCAEHRSKESWRAHYKAHGQKCIACQAMQQVLRSKFNFNFFGNEPTLYIKTKTEQETFKLLAKIGIKIPDLTVEEAQDLATNRVIPRPNKLGGSIPNVNQMASGTAKDKTTKPTMKWVQRKA